MWGDYKASLRNANNDDDYDGDDDDDVDDNDDDDANDDDDEDEHPWVTLEPHTLSRTFPPGSREPTIIGGKLLESSSSSSSLSSASSLSSTSS